MWRVWFCFHAFKVKQNRKFVIPGGDVARGKVDQVDDKKLRAHSGELFYSQHLTQISSLWRFIINQSLSILLTQI